MNMTLKEAIDYLQPIADSTPLAGYGAALAVALDAMRAQEARLRRHKQRNEEAQGDGRE